MKKNKSQIKENIYDNLTLKKGLVVAIVLLVGFAGFLINFPIKEVVRGMITSTIDGQKACPIAYKAIEVSLFLPKVVIDGATISGKCFNNPQANLKLDTLSIHLGIPGIFPPNLKFKVFIKKDRSEISIYPRISFNQIIVKILDTQVDATLLKIIAPDSPALSGNIKIDGLISIEKGAVNDAQLQITSKDFALPSQNLNTLEIPTLQLNNLLIDSTYSNREISVSSLILGDTAAPLHLGLKGKIKINSFSVSASTLNLGGEIKYSQEFQDAFPIFNLWAAGKTPKNGAYQIKVTGSLGSPTPLFL